MSGRSVVETTIRFKEACSACPERSRGELVEEACSELVEEADLRIYLLGLPRAEYLGGVLAVPRRQVRALLFRLAARLQPVSREHLCFLFWPDLPESTARRNLSRLLPQLRSALRVPQALVITDDQVWLDPGRIWSDTATFERLCAEREPQRQINAFAQAIDLYRGPFLDAFFLPGSPEFESWVSLEREGWQQLYLKLLAFLVEKHVAREDYAAAITYARRYLETDDLAEDIHRRLIELYAAVGDRGAALRQYERCAATLEREAARLWDSEAIAANQRLQVQALYERGWALRLLGDMQAYEHDLPKVKRLTEILGDASLLAHLRWREAYTHRWFCRYAEARDAAEEGIHLSQAVADRSLEAMCWREVGRAARATGDCGDAQMALERALSLFAGLGDVVHELHALSNLSTLYWRLGEHERAMHIALRALARCDEAELPLERRLPLGDVGVAAAAAGDVDLAWRCLLESLSIARQIADRTQEIFCLAHLGWLCVQQKRAPEALEHLHPALALAERIGSRAEQSWLHSGLAEAYRLLGNPDRAVEHARRALELAQATGRFPDQRLAQSVLDELETPDL